MRRSPTCAASQPLRRAAARLGCALLLALVGQPAAARAQDPACTLAVSDSTLAVTAHPEGGGSLGLSVEARRATISLLDDVIELEGSVLVRGTGARSLPLGLTRRLTDAAGIVSVGPGSRLSLGASDGALSASVELGSTHSRVRIGPLPIPCDALALAPTTRGADDGGASAIAARTDATRWVARASPLRIFASPDTTAASLALTMRYPEDVILQRTESRDGWMRVFFVQGATFVHGWARAVELAPYEPAGGGGMIGHGYGRGTEAERAADFEGELALPRGTALHAARDRGRWGELAREVRTRVRWTVEPGDDALVWVRVLALPGVREARASGASLAERSPTYDEALRSAWARVPLALIPGGAAILARAQRDRPRSPGVEALAAARAERGVIVERRLALGGDHGCLLRDGAVLCWGAAAALGDGSTADRDHAARVPELDDATSIVAAGGATCALRARGGVWCWGALPVAGTARPTAIPGLEDAVTLDLRGTLCATRRDGRVACLGPDGATTDVEGVVDAIDVAHGGSHVCALRAAGRVVCWGSGSSGQLGVEGTSASSHPLEVPGVLDAVQLAAGDERACARLRDGRVSCWGDPIDGGARAPHVLAGLEGATDLALGARSLCARSAAGAVRCLAEGGGLDAPILGGASPYSGPATIAATEGSSALAIGGRGTACVLDAEGHARCWGERTVRVARPVRGMSGVRVVAVGHRETCAALDDGTVRCWPELLSPLYGAASVADLDAAAGELCRLRSDGAVDCRSARALGEHVTALSVATGVVCVVAAGAVRCHFREARAADPSAILGPVVDVAASYQRACTVEASGRVVCWHAADAYGDEEPEPPLVVPGVSDAANVEITFGYGCLRRRSGALACFTEHGAVDLPSLREVRSFDVESDRVCAVRGDGSVHCLAFESGYGTRISRWLPPMRVPGVERATQVSVGAEHACARIEDGTVRCWGRGAGALIDGVSGPVAVEGR